jgi:hypothetical protein
MPTASPKFSILDLSPIVQGGDAALALRNTRDLAQHAERWGYRRYWLAEHHNMTGIASAATALVIQHVAAGTSTIRVGAGGIMLPNHAPLSSPSSSARWPRCTPAASTSASAARPAPTSAPCARCGATSATAARPSRRTSLELQAYFRPAQPGQASAPCPARAWTCRSGCWAPACSARSWRPMLGLPFAFASHFAPAYLAAGAAHLSRALQAVGSSSKPYVMLGMGCCSPPTDAEAQRLFTSLQQQFLNLVRGTPGPLKPPVDSLDGIWTPPEQTHIERSLAFSAVGSPETVRARIAALCAEHQPDELMLTAQIFDHAARLRSFELVSQLRAGLSGNR